MSSQLAQAKTKRSNIEYNNYNKNIKSISRITKINLAYNIVINLRTKWQVSDAWMHYNSEIETRTTLWTSITTRTKQELVSTYVYPKQDYGNTNLSFTIQIDHSKNLQHRHHQYRQPIWDSVGQWLQSLLEGTFCWWTCPYSRAVPSFSLSWSLVPGTISNK